MADGRSDIPMLGSQNSLLIRFLAAADNTLTRRGSGMLQRWRRIYGNQGIASLFTLEVKIVNKTIECEIQTDLKKDDQFYFYLVKDGAIIHRSGWSSISSLVYPLQEPGSYFVQAHLKRDGKNTLQKSQSYFYGAQSSLNELQQEWARSDFSIITEPKLYQLATPFSSFLVSFVSHADKQLLLECNKVDHQLSKTKDIEFKVGTFTQYEFGTHSTSTNDCLLSGTAICKSRFIFGQADVTSDLSVQDFSSALGNFVVVGAEENGILISTDYFGFSKIYYYEQGSSFFASNSYHLLLRSLKAIGINLEVDFDVACSKLNFINLQPFAQSFTRRMDVAGVMCLSIDKAISIGDEGVLFVDKSIAKDLEAESKISDSEYLELLNKAKDEIINNVAAVVKHPKFKRIIVDVSGGMDSRLVFCAVTNLPQYRDKIFINSQDTRGAPQELPVALTINENYRYKYDNIPEKIEVLSPKGLYEDTASYYMGTYYSYNYPYFKVRRDETIRLTGGGGEVIARPYYSRAYLNTDLDIEDPEFFVNKYFDALGYLSVLGKNSNIHDISKELFLEELKLIPGTSAIEKFDLHYLYHRNGFHFSEGLRVDTSGPEFAILQSKSAFQIKKRTFAQHKSIKFQLDLMSALNPLLSQYPYESDKDNSAKASLGSSLVPVPEYLASLSLQISDEREAWIAAQDEKQLSKSVESDNYEGYKEQHRKLLDNRLKDIVSALHLICGDDDALAESFAAPIYYYAKQNFKGQDSSVQFQSLHTKIMSLAHQLVITSRAI